VVTDRVSFLLKHRLLQQCIPLRPMLKCKKFLASAVAKPGQGKALFFVGCFSKIEFCNETIGIARCSL
jgi:hypothetical protein